MHPIPSPGAALQRRQALRSFLGVTPALVAKIGRAHV